MSGVQGSASYPQSDEALQGYPGILQRLFPGHPARRVLCESVYATDDGSTKKRVVTVGRGARCEDFVRHLDRASFDGKGALGIIPTYPERPRQKSRWLVCVFGFDFDSVSVADLMPLIHVLQEYRVYAYVDEGTTGRGAHLYNFLSEPLPQRDAHAVSVAVAKLSKHLGLPYPEFVPSSSSGPGKGMFLPYRGAQEDGYGANPLIDSMNGNYLHLEEVEQGIERTEPDDLLVLVEDFGGDRSGSESTYEAPDFGTYANGLEAWGIELERLRQAWTEGRRQNLALGATAYGIAVGISSDKIRKDIKELEEGSSSPEIDVRLEAVNRTFLKYSKGEKIAWRTFYEQAQLEPPRANRVVPWTVLLKLKALGDKLRNTAFKGVAGFTDSDVMDALVEVGERYGKPRPDGVEVSISVRDLALKARASRQTVMASLKRLQKNGWIRRSDRGNGTNSGSLLLLMNDEDADSYAWSDEEAGSERGGEGSIFIPKFRWGAGKLGKMSRPILEHVRSLQPCKRAEVARAMGRKNRDIRDPWNRLIEHRLLEHDEDTDTFYLPEDFEDRLFEVFLADGTWQTDYKHQERFERDRMTFRSLRTFKRNSKVRTNVRGG